MKNKEEQFYQICTNIIKYLIRIVDHVNRLDFKVNNLQELIQSLASNNKDNAPPFTHDSQNILKLLVEKLRTNLFPLFKKIL